MKMMRLERNTIGITFAAGLFVAMLANGCGRRTAQAAPKSVEIPVTSVDSEKMNVPDLRRYPGNTEAVQQVTLEARVEGFLKQRLFEEGTSVTAGETLFVIEQPPYEANVLEAQGKLRSAEAAFDFARSEFTRNEPLVSSGAISAQDFDQYRSNLASAAAQMQVAEANLINARINLGYTEVTAPFDGRIGRRLVDVGNLVGPGINENLAVLVDLDPMRVVFQPAGTELPDYLVAWPSSKVGVKVTVQGIQETMTFEGDLDLVDNEAAVDSSTFIARASFPNTDLKLVPGLFAEIEVDLGTLKDQVVVPVEAIQSEPQQAYVWTVKDEKLARVNVTLGPQWKELRVVTGLDPGIPVVVEGNPYMLKTDVPVRSKTLSLDAWRKEVAGKQAAKSSKTKGGRHPAQTHAAKHGVEPSAATGHENSTK
ncbi:MAG: efflux RND transporter periplasmic adaptor subunit [Phycisphaerales bacterium]|jgi:RND family efflux transporter MFP subunit|nr:efflux RND transporter periplasmic adaptor subunit [Phycisphaerales bacterium]